MGDRLLLFTKPALPGRVKTRLVGDLSPEQTAELHAAFLRDVRERLTGRSFELVLAWALDPGEKLPDAGSGVRQPDGDLGDRLYGAIRDSATEAGRIAAVGSDHPELAAETVEEAFRRLEEGADVVLGPARDGGYYLVALRREAVCPELFRDIPWSTAGVLDATLERARQLGLRVELLAPGDDVDEPADLERLVARLRRGEEGAPCPATRRVLARWGLLEPAPRDSSPAAKAEETACAS